MKMDLIRTIIAVGIGILTSWGFHALAQDPTDGLPLCLAIGIETGLSGIGLVGIEYDEYPRSGTMIRAACAFGIVLLLGINAIYAYTGVNTSFYVLNGIISLVLLLIVNSIHKIKQ